MSDHKHARAIEMFRDELKEHRTRIQHAKQRCAEAQKRSEYEQGFVAQLLEDEAALVQAIHALVLMP